MTGTLEMWMVRYADDHRNLKNKRIHFICVPLIFFSVLGLLSQVPLHAGSTAFTLGQVLALFVLAFYLRHSPALFAGFAIIVLVFLFLIGWISSQEILHPWLVFILIFVLAWIGQFIGHKHEGKKPSFLTDLVFLLIGPAWILAHIYQRLGIRY